MSQSPRQSLRQRYWCAINTCQIYHLTGLLEFFLAEYLRDFPEDAPFVNR